MSSTVLRLPLASLPLVLALAACGPDAAGPEPEPQPDPTWETTGLERRWSVVGIGETYELMPVPDGAGGTDLVVGGRRLARFTPDGLAAGDPAWKLTWPDDPALPAVGRENRPTHGLAAYDADGDGREELLVLQEKNGFLVDPETGALRHAFRFDTALPPLNLVLLERDEAPPDLVAAGGDLAVFSGATGERLWGVDFDYAAVHLASGRLEATGPGLVVGLEVDTWGLYGAAASTRPGDPAVFGFTAAGEPLFEFVPQGLVDSVAAGDLDGSGPDEVLAGTDQGVVHRLGTDGAEHWTVFLGNGRVRQLMVQDVTGDGRNEILALLVTAVDPGPFYSSVVALDPDGNELWRRPVGLPSARFGLFRPNEAGPYTLVAVADETKTGSGLGSVAALDPSDGTVLWQSEDGARTSALVRWDGEDLLALGGEDTRIRLVHLGTGEPVTHGSGGAYVFAIDAADLDGDGALELVTGDMGGRFAAWDEQGRPRWQGFLPGTEIQDVAMGELGPGAWHAAAVGVGGQGNYRGALQVRDAEGGLVASVSSYYLFWQVEFVDVTGDGTAEILVAASAGVGGRCAVLVFDAAGEPLQEVELPSCFYPTLSVGASEDGAGAEIGVVGVGINAPSWAAVLEGDLSVRWLREVPMSQAHWGALTGRDLVVLGSVGEQAQATAVRLSGPDGTELWRYEATPVEAPVNPETSVSSVFQHGSLVPGAGRDGGPAVAASATDNSLHVLDAETGELLWQVHFQAPDTPPEQWRLGGKVAYVPPTAGTPAWFAVGETAYFRNPTRLRAFGLDGRLLATFDNDGETQAMVPVRTGSDRSGVAVGAGLGLHLFEAFPAAR